ncbi:hypothetical protein Acr_24g0000860 [Actinidia rufa]|uniref:CCHC-type domain-containing protein n=1 Tax=Actinidia rufa TaxID=165716 RepID=A0A7J0GSX4_9ERIC|nr:hypothetical protein Acr_24g0000860 [Actinidia rufa]
MPPRNVRGCAESLTGARGACGAHGARRNCDEGDDGNHQESVMGGGASAPGGNMGGAPPTVLGATEFMQGVFTVIEQMVRNTVQTMQVLGESDPLVAEDWLEQVTRALDTILVTEEELRVLFASYQLQGDAFQWWKTVEEGVDKNNEAKYTSLSRFARAFVSTEEEKGKQFMRGLRPSIRNKIVGNLIKVYSTMVSSAVTIEETLNETRKIVNLKSQRPICFGCHEFGHRVADCPLRGQLRQSQQGENPAGGRMDNQWLGATYLFSVWSHSTTMHTEEQHSRSFGITATCSISSGLEGHSSNYISTDFVSIRTTSYSSARSSEPGEGEIVSSESGEGEIASSESGEVGGSEKSSPEVGGYATARAQGQIWFNLHASTAMLLYQSYVSETERIHAIPSQVQRHILAGLASVMGGLSAPYEKASHVHERPVVNWLWATGCHPFGPFSNTSQVSKMLQDIALRTTIYARVDSALHRIRDTSEAVQSFAGEYLKTPLGEPVKGKKNKSSTELWLEKFYKKTANVPEPFPHELVERLEKYLDGLEEQLVDLSSLLYDHRLHDAHLNSTEILQSSIFTQQ